MSTATKTTPALRTSQKTMSEALRVADLAVSQRATIEALRCLRLRATEDGLALQAANMDFQIHAKIGGERTGEELDVLVPLVPLKKALAAFDTDAEIEISDKDKGIELRSGRRRLTIGGNPSGGLPVDPSGGKKGKRVIRFAEGKPLAAALKRALICAGRDEIRPILHAVLLDTEEDVLCATDSYRLAVVPLPESTGKVVEQKLLLPYQLALALSKQLGRGEGPVQISSFDRGVIIEQGDVRFSARCVEGTYPDWRALSKVSGTGKGELDADELAGALKAMAAIAPKDDAAAVLEFAAEGCELSFDGGAGNQLRERLEKTTYSGESVRIGFNHAFLGDALKLLGAKQVAITVASPIRPGLLEAEDCTVVLMPVRLTS